MGLSGQEVYANTIPYVNIEHVDASGASVNVPESVTELTFEERHSGKVTLQKDADPPGVLFHAQHIQAKIRAHGHLGKFPFDNQELDVCLAMHGSLERKNDIDQGRVMLPLNVCCELAHQLPDWTVFQPKVKVTSGKNRRQVLTTTICLKRDSSYFVWNVIGPLACFTTMALALYRIPIEDQQDRMANCLTILLTLVAYKFFIANMLPKVPYLTELDVYIWCCMAILIIVFVEFAVAAHIEYYPDEQLNATALTAAGNGTAAEAYGPEAKHKDTFIGDRIMHEDWVADTETQFVTGLAVAWFLLNLRYCVVYQRHKPYFETREEARCLSDAERHREKKEKRWRTRERKRLVLDEHRVFKHDEDQSLKQRRQARIRRFTKFEERQLKLEREIFEYERSERPRRRARHLLHSLWSSIKGNIDWLTAYTITHRLEDLRPEHYRYENIQEFDGERWQPYTTPFETPEVDAQLLSFARTMIGQSGPDMEADTDTHMDVLLAPQLLTRAHLSLDELREIYEDDGLKALMHALEEAGVEDTGTQVAIQQGLREFSSGENTNARADVLALQGGATYLAQNFFDLLNHWKTNRDGPSYPLEREFGLVLSKQEFLDLISIYPFHLADKAGSDAAGLIGPIEMQELASAVCARVLLSSSATSRIRTVVANRKYVTRDQHGNLKDLPSQFWAGYLARRHVEIGQPCLVIDIGSGKVKPQYAVRLSRDGKPGPVIGEELGSFDRPERFLQMLTAAVRAGDDHWCSEHVSACRLTGKFDKLKPRGEKLGLTDQEEALLREYYNLEDHDVIQLLTAEICGIAAGGLVHVAADTAGVQAKVGAPPQRIKIFFVGTQKFRAYRDDTELSHGARLTELLQSLAEWAGLYLRYESILTTPAGSTQTGRGPPPRREQRRDGKGPRAEDVWAFTAEEGAEEAFKPDVTFEILPQAEQALCEYEAYKLVRDWAEPSVSPVAVAAMQSTKGEPLKLGNCAYGSGSAQGKLDGHRIVTVPIGTGDLCPTIAKYSVAGAPDAKTVCFKDHSAMIDALQAAEQLLASKLSNYSPSVTARAVQWVRPSPDCGDKLNKLYEKLRAQQSAAGANDGTQGETTQHADHRLFKLLSDCGCIEHIDVFKQNKLTQSSFFGLGPEMILDELHRAGIRAAGDRIRILHALNKATVVRPARSDSQLSRRDGHGGSAGRMPSGSSERSATDGSVSRAGSEPAGLHVYGRSASTPSQYPAQSMSRAGAMQNLHWAASN